MELMAISEVSTKISNKDELDLVKDGSSAIKMSKFGLPF